MQAPDTLTTLFRLTLASGVGAAVALHLRRGAPVNGRDARGRTPLILAAGRGHAEVCQLLLGAGADVALRDNDGRTALETAQSSGHVFVAALLAIAEKSLNSGEAASPGAPGQDVVVPETSSFRQSAAPVSDQVISPVEDIPHQNQEHEHPDGEHLPANPFEDIPAVVSSGDDQSDVWLPDEELPAGAIVSNLSLISWEPPVETTMSSTLARTAPKAPLPALLLPDVSLQDFLWEPDPEPVLALVETGMEAAAASIQTGLTRFRASTSDTDWTRIDVALPEIVTGWAESFIDDFDARQSTQALFATALYEGWLPIEQLEELTAKAVDSQHAISAARALRQVLDSMGISVEEEHALEPGRFHAGLSFDAPAVHRMEIAIATGLLADVTDDEPDAETLLIADAGRAPILSEAQEKLLFRELHQLLATMLRLAATAPSTADLLTLWSEYLTAGQLTPREISTIEWGSSHAGLAEAMEAETRLLADEDETDASDVYVDGEERLAVHALTSMLKEVADRIVQGNDPVLALGSLALTSRRIMELAENVLSLNESVAHRRGRRRKVSARTRVPDLHMLNVRFKARSLPLPDHEIGVALDGYIAARQAIVEGNLRRVVWNARRYSRGPLPFLDLVQEGQIGLLRAIDKFDSERGIRFGTYATWWIRQSIHRAMQDSGRTIRVPVHMLERMRKIQRRVEALKVRHGVEPTPADVARDMEEDPRVIERALSADIEVVSLDEIESSVFEEEDASFLADASIRFQSADSGMPLSAVFHVDLRRRLLAALENLDPKQARILDLRFGITTGESMTLEEVGQIYGVTRERIRQIEAKALARMPRLLPKHGFENMLP